MSQEEQFPKAKFMEALKTTKQIKGKLAPFLEAYSKMNIPWIFDSLATLHSVVISSNHEPKIRLNAMFALKILFCTCNYAIVNLIETYFINVLMAFATYEAGKPLDERGHQFFIQNGHKDSKDEAIEQYGFNAVTLGTEMILAAAIIKPKRLYYNEQTDDKSDFCLASQKLMKKLKSKLQKWSFFGKESPEALRQKFQVNIVEIDDEKIDNYSNYIDKAFYESLKAGFPKQQGKFDVRQVIKSGDMYVSDGPVEMNGQAMMKGKINTVLNCLSFYHELAMSVNPQIIQSFHDNIPLQAFAKSAAEIPGSDKSLKRGSNFLEGKKYSAEEKKQIYCEFLMKIQIWAHTYLKFNPKTKGISKIAKYYELLKNIRGYEFPKNPNFEKQIKEAETNFQKNKSKIGKFIKQIKKQLPDEAPLSFLQEVQENIKKSEKVSPQKSHQSPQKPKQENIKLQSQASIKKQNQKVAEVPKQSSPQKVKTQSKINVEDPKRHSMQDSQSKPKQSVKNIYAKENTQQKPKQSVKNFYAKEKDEEKPKQSVKNFNAKEKDQSKPKQSVKNFYAAENVQPKNSEKGNQIKSKEKTQSQSKIPSQPSKQVSKQIQTKSPEKQEGEKIVNNTVDRRSGQSPNKQNQELVKKDSSPSIKDRLQSNQMEQSQKHDMKNESLNKTPDKKISENAKPKSTSSKKHVEVISKIEEQPKKAQKTKTSQFKQKLLRTEKILKSLLESESQMAQKVDSLEKQKRYLEVNVQTVVLEDEEIDIYMEKCFKCIDAIDVVSAHFRKYQEGKIKVEQLQSAINKVNGISGQMTPNSEVKNGSEKKITAKFEDESLKKKLEKENEELVKKSQNQSLKVIKLQIPIYPRHMVNEKVQFSDNSCSMEAGNETLEVTLPTSNINIQTEIFQPKKLSKRKMKKPDTSIMENLQSEVKNIELESKEKAINSSEITPIKLFQSKAPQRKMQEVNGEQKQVKEYIYENDEEQYIEKPDLNPLDNSYHDAAEALNKKQARSFKDVLGTDAYLQGNKGENMFWMKNESQNLIKPTGNSKKIQVFSKINVPEILHEKNKKFQSEMKQLQQTKDKQIRQLENKLKLSEEEKDLMRTQLKQKQSQIESLKQQSEKTMHKQQFSIIEDIQNLQKRQKRLQQEKHKFVTTLNHEGKLINIKMFEQLFREIGNERDKKKQLKNKELFFKDRTMEIGCMGHRDKNKYTLACFITPQVDLKLLSVKVNRVNNLRVDFENCEGLVIPKRKQYKIPFHIEILQIPYQLPEVQFQFESSENKHHVNFPLPCGFQKFFQIFQLSSAQMKSYFNKQHIFRGEQIPYSMRILKNLDSLMDYLPHIRRLKDEEGEACFGGMASYDNIQFPLKVRIKPNHFLYIQSVDIMETSESVKAMEFYIGTLNTLLMKDISWN